MYIFVAILLFFALTTLTILHFRKKRIIKKICNMTPYQRTNFVNKLAEPLGYIYDTRQDIFSNTSDAWQKDFGYTAAYNDFAPYLGMIFNYLPVYFYYNEKTWLIEFWKGQYGINVGCEAGIYNIDRKVPKQLRGVTLFKAAEKDEVFPITMELSTSDRRIAKICKKQWWVTIFSPGHFKKPKDLSAHFTLYFPVKELCDAFENGLNEAGYSKDDYYRCCNKISLCLKEALSKYCLLKRVYCRYVLFKNYIFCRLFRFVTRPFICSRDRVLLLYYYLPFAFRRMLKQKRRQI